VWDLGFNDSMSIILAQKVASEVRIIHYIEGTQRTLADYSAELKALTLDGQPINWGNFYLPHDGFAKRHQWKAGCRSLARVWLEHPANTADGCGTGHQESPGHLQPRVLQQGTRRKAVGVLEAVSAADHQHYE
jgi:hypothetical protein